MLNSRASVPSATLPTPTPIDPPSLPHAYAPRPLNSKQLTALSLIIMGKTDPQVCSALGIDRKTLYTWKHKHPLFRDELARRQDEVWSVLSHRIRLTLLKAVDVFRHQLDATDDDTALRAARSLLPLIGAPRLAPPAPADPNQILDDLLKSALPPGAAAALTPAHRQALLTRLLDPESPTTDDGQSATDDGQLTTDNDHR